MRLRHEFFFMSGYAPRRVLTLVPIEHGGRSFTRYALLIDRYDKTDAIGLARVLRPAILTHRHRMKSQAGPLKTADTAMTLRGGNGREASLDRSFEGTM